MMMIIRDVASGRMWIRKPNDGVPPGSNSNNRNNLSKTYRINFIYFISFTFASVGVCCPVLRFMVEEKNGMAEWKTGREMIPIIINLNSTTFQFNFNLYLKIKEIVVWQRQRTEQRMIEWNEIKKYINVDCGNNKKPNAKNKTRNRLLTLAVARISLTYFIFLNNIFNNSMFYVRII